MYNILLLEPSHKHVGIQSVSGWNFFNSLVHKASHQTPLIAKEENGVYHYHHVDCAPILHKRHSADHAPSN